MSGSAVSWSRRTSDPGINLCDYCISEITGHRYYDDMDELAKDIKTWWESIKNQEKR